MLKEPNQIDIQPIFNNQFQCKVSKVLVLRNRDKDLRKSVLYNLCKRRFQRQSLTNLPEVQESTMYGLLLIFWDINGISKLTL